MDVHDTEIAEWIPDDSAYTVYVLYMCKER